MEFFNPILKMDIETTLLLVLIELVIIFFLAIHTSHHARFWKAMDVIWSLASGIIILSGILAYQAEISEKEISRLESELNEHKADINLYLLFNRDSLPCGSNSEEMLEYCDIEERIHELQKDFEKRCMISATEIVENLTEPNSSRISKPLPEDSFFDNKINYTPIPPKLISKDNFSKKIKKLVDSYNGKLEILSNKTGQKFNNQCLENKESTNPTISSDYKELESLLDFYFHIISFILFPLKIGQTVASTFERSAARNYNIQNQIINIENDYSLVTFGSSKQGKNKIDIIKPKLDVEIDKQNIMENRYYSIFKFNK